MAIQESSKAQKSNTAILKQRNSQVAKVVQKYRSFIVMANNIQSMEIAICSLAKRKTFVLTVIFERHWCSSEECFKF